ncbi:hypothetical protein D3C76_1305300 [compost metagenome]
MTTQHIGKLVAQGLQIFKRISLIPRLICEPKRDFCTLASIYVTINRLIGQIDLPRYVPRKLFLNLIPIKIGVGLIIAAQIG